MSLQEYFNYNINFNTSNSLTLGQATIGSIFTPGSGMLTHTVNTFGNIFTTGGNVGIGTTSPSTTLDVSGTGRFTTSITTANLYSTSVISDNISSTNLVLTNNSTGGVPLSTSSVVITLNPHANSYSFIMDVNNFSTNNEFAAEVILPDPTGVIQYNPSFFNYMKNKTATTLNLQVRFTGDIYQSYSEASQELRILDENNNFVSTICTITIPAATDPFGWPPEVYSLNTGYINITLPPNYKIGAYGTGYIQSITFEYGTAVTINYALTVIGNSTLQNISTSNINFTGTLSKNGSQYISSQWRGTSGTISFGTGSNLVGINTQNPSYTLDVNGTFEAYNSNGLMAFTQNGQVGIGTVSPGEALDVRGNLRIGSSSQSNYISFYGTTGDEPGTWTHTYIGERIYGGNENSELLLFKGNDMRDPSGPDRIRLLAAEHRFDTYTTDVSGTFENVASTIASTRMIISTTGNVGIGTTSPIYTLDVNGSGRFSNNLLATFNSNTLGNIFTTGGNVGINVASPSYTLDVNGSLRSTGDIFVGNGIGAEALNLWDIPGAAWQLATGDHKLNIRNGTIGSTMVDRVTIASTGNVGIGTIAPSNLLHVNGIAALGTLVGNATSQTANDTLYLGTTGNTNFFIDRPTGNTGGSIILGFNTAKTLVQRDVFTIYNNSTDRNTLFQVQSKGASGNDQITIPVSLIASFNSNTVGSIITTGGNVGIGVIAPLEKLHIDGSIFLNTGGSLWITGNSDNAVNRFRFHNIIGTSFIDFNGGPLSIRNGTGGLSDSNVRMLINTNGNVGIGTITPSEKLHVNGNIKNTGYNYISSFTLTTGSAGTVLIATGNGGLYTGRILVNAVGGGSHSQFTIDISSCYSELNSATTPSIIVKRSQWSGGANVSNITICSAPSNGTYISNYFITCISGTALTITLLESTGGLLSLTTPALTTLTAGYIQTVYPIASTGILHGAMGNYLTVNTTGVGINSSNVTSALQVNGAITHGGGYAVYGLSVATYGTGNQQMSFGNTQFSSRITNSGNYFTFQDAGIFMIHVKINSDTIVTSGIQLFCSYYNGTSWVTYQSSEDNRSYNNQGEFVTHFMVQASANQSWAMFLNNQSGANWAFSTDAVSGTYWSRLMIYKVA
jgi:hypothetical protein